MKKQKTITFRWPWVLTLTMPIFIFTLFLYQNNPGLQFQVVIVAAFSYLGLALLHHYEDKTLTMEIIIQYILIAALALIVLQSLLFK